MSNLAETPVYDPGVYQLEVTDPVLGGPDGVSNFPQKNLANRTAYLKAHLDVIESGAGLPAGIARLDSPAFTGSPTAPNQPLGDNDTSIANTAFVQGTVGGKLSKSVAGGANVTLTAVEAGNAILELTGALSANISVIVPNSPTRSWIVYNATAGAFSLIVKNAAGSGASISQGKRATVYTDGTNVVKVDQDVTVTSGGGGGGGGTGTVTSVTAASPLVSSGGTDPAISMPAATSAVSGYLSAGDWSKFNAKQDPTGMQDLTGLTDYVNQKFSLLQNFGSMSNSPSKSIGGLGQWIWSNFTVDQSVRGTYYKTLMAEGGTTGVDYNGNPTYTPMVVGNCRLEIQNLSTVKVLQVSLSGVIDFASDDSYAFKVKVNDVEVGSFGPYTARGIQTYNFGTISVPANSTVNIDLYGTILSGGNGDSLFVNAFTATFLQFV